MSDGTPLGAVVLAAACLLCPNARAETRSRAADRNGEPSAAAAGPSIPRAPVGADTTSDEPRPQFAVAAEGSYFARVAADRVDHLGGGGLLFAVSLVPVWLGLAYRVRAVGDGQTLAFPMEVLLELTAHLGETAQPFVGVGPTLVPRFEEGSTVEAGLAAALGSYFWLTGAVGIVAEVRYGLIIGADLVHEPGASAGVAYRF